LLKRELVSVATSDAGSWINARSCKEDEKDQDTDGDKHKNSSS
jgi:hypothetical protein